MQTLFKLPELQFLNDDLQKEKDGVKLYKRLLKNEFSESKLNP